MGLFCLHHWEIPSYVQALNLREGLKKCQKCGSIKGFKRFVPLEYDQIKKVDYTIPDKTPISVLPILSAIVTLGVGIAVMMTILPTVMQAVGAVMQAVGEAQDSVGTEGASGSLTSAFGTLLGLIPIIIPVMIAMMGLSFFIRAFQGFGGSDSEEEEDDFDDSPPAREARRKADKPIYRDSRFTVNGRKVK